MGIIIKQSIKGAVWSYLGVVIGFITTAYIYPNYLTPEIVGLFALLMAWSDLFAQFSMLGFQGVTARLFPYFRDKAKGHNGFLFIAFMVMLTGFALSVITFFFLRGWLVESNLEKSALFVDYVNVLIPLIFFGLLFNFLDIFIKMLYDAVLASFLKEFLQRVLILAILLVYIFGWISPNALIFAYAGAVCFKGAFLFFYLLFRKEISLSPQPGFVDRKLKKEMLSVAVFAILSGIGGSIVFQIDKIIINQAMGLSATGVYTIAFFFGTLVVIPSRTLLKISGTLIADAFKRNDMKTIADIYRKSCLNQFIIAAFLFGGIWININNILTILGPDYAGGKWVIFFIGLGYMIDMATGANSHIISLSKYYRMGLWFLVILVVIVVAAMFLFIPIWGISGAAAAIALAFFLNNLMRYVFLKIKYGFQPFTLKFLYVPIVFFVAWGISSFIPELKFIPDILLRSSVFTVLFSILIYFLNVSEDVNVLVNKLIKDNFNRLLKN
ncbi:lipopolysaccharide biosynthesis protein [Maribellus sp. CM-23]|uniref:lipopolysaccharide biosynthesis protein n=1 Tax=Maribellus sp. CM-23 TaxID=2781026 RepID=UPI001F35EAAA|nr:lipopolysaccharide biosynthesis protein [Maribellus sp. CM-23]MCE4566657.1 lipopolysaccharide biosynthesis protein [Maribellus sp. CM-23]